MFDCLVKHGCADFSSMIDPTGYSPTVIASGGFGDVWQARINGGILVAVKCLRLHMILKNEEKGMKVSICQYLMRNFVQHGQLMSAHDARNISLVKIAT